MKLDILITHYNEPMDIVVPLLESINEQRNIDFNDVNVVIANDGEDVILNREELDLFRFNVRYISHPKSNVSATRNLAFDESYGDYVMFCDCDDCFHNLYGLSLIFQTMAKGYDVISTPFIEELLVKDEIRLVRHDKDLTFIHGKVFKRAYLVEKNIRFDETLSLHEDGYFVALAKTLTENKVETGTPVYSWCWNDKSVVRQSEKFVLRTYDHLIKSREAIAKKYTELGMKECVEEAVAKTIFESFFEMNGNTTEEERKRIITYTAPFYKKYEKVLTEMNKRRSAEIFAMCRNTAFARGLCFEKITIGEYLKLLTEVRV